MFMGALDRPTLDTKWTARLKQGLGIIVLLLGIVWFLGGVAPMAGFVPGSPPSTPAAGGIRWVSSVDEGLADAKDRGEPAIIDFRADWCVYCKEMDREVFADPEVVRESARFVMIRADATSRTPEVDALERRFAAPGPPTLVFVWPDGQHKTVPGKIDRDTMLQLMQAVR
jgi:thiol:disulfide interchange protein DsbD